MRNHNYLEPIPVLFERTVAKWPDMVAAEDDTQSVTYDELLRRVNFQANQLVAHGVKYQDRVGVMVRHSCDLIVSLLAIMRAQATYVPIDPSYPEPRKQFIVNDSGLVLLITEPGGHGFTNDPALPTVSPERETADSCVIPDEISGEDLACIIYTSGSTGRPKGTMICHRGLSNLASAAAKTFELRENDRFLMLASPSFSASLEELFPPLLSGAASVFVKDRSELTAVHSLLQVIESRRVTLLELQTAHWQVLMQYLTEAERTLPPSLRLIVMGGDRAPADSIRQWNSVGIPLVHVYGPTEATATATYWTVPPGQMPGDGVLSIGEPIDDTQLHVVSDLHRLVDRGTPGELLIGGVSLARGYLGQPGMTAERFIPDPFSRVPGAVLYRTGDLVRRLQDGRLQFLERIDEQVKVHGHRIEPAEIEEALLRHHLIRQAMVRPWTNPHGQVQLAAYVTTDTDSLTPTAIRSFLGEILPSHMIPAAFVCINEFPLTLHRKIDMDALPNPLPSRPNLGTEYVAAQDPVESVISGIAAGLLGIDEVGVLDNFHELGGDSQFMLFMIVRIEARYNVRLGFREAFGNPTIRGLASRIRRANAGT